MDTTVINGIEYVALRKASENRVIIRTRDAGVHYGTIASRDGDTITLTDSRRIWFWKGAASLSQLAVSGVTCPDECRFSVRVPEIKVFGAIEIIKCSALAEQIIEDVAEWSA